MSQPNYEFMDDGGCFIIPAVLHTTTLDSSSGMSEPIAELENTRFISVHRCRLLQHIYRYSQIFENPIGNSCHVLFYNIAILSR